MTADRSNDDPQTEAFGDAEPAGDAGIGPDVPPPSQQSGRDGSGSSASEEDASQELEALNDRYLRLAAEYENYRRRTERERADSWVKAQAQLVEKLLDSLDDLQRVAHFQAETTNVAALLEGVQMVERKLARVLELAGLEQIDAHGQPFDPAQHEALMTAAAESSDEDETVGEVFQKGYRFKGDLLRPARVQVRKHEG